MRFLILGAGALGGYYGGLLQKGGADVTFLVRSRTAHRLSSEGIRIRLEKEFYSSPVQIASAKQVRETFDVIILAVAHDEFLDIDYEKLKSTNSIIYDIKGFLPENIISYRL